MSKQAGGDADLLMGDVLARTPGVHRNPELTHTRFGIPMGRLDGDG